MNPSAIEQAEELYENATQAILALKAAASHKEADKAWLTFLAASQTIYSKLEQGAKGFPKSEPWFGRQKQLRKKDPLLRYLHFARNSNEHGIERVTARSNANAQLKFNERHPFKMRRLDQETLQPVGDPIDVVVAGPTIKLVRVYDRKHGDFCDPPAEHLGRTLPNGRDFPLDCGVAALTYFKLMLAEAKALVA